MRRVAFFAGLIICWATATVGWSKVEIAGFNLGFGATYASGTWTPLRIVLTNLPDTQHGGEKPRDFKGEVHAIVTDNNAQAVRYAQAVELPFQSSKQIEFSVQLADNPAPLIVEMNDEKGRLLARTEIPLGARQGQNLRNKLFVPPTVLLEKDPNQNVNFPCWVSHSANIQRIGLEELPSDVKSYSTVRVVVARDRIHNKLSEPQLKALEEWIASGGQLVVILPRNLEGIKLDPWLKPRLPGIPATTREARLEEIYPGSGNDKTLIAQWEKIDPSARTFWNSSVGPIALARPLGQGQIIALGVDPAALGGNSMGTPVGIQMQRVLESCLLAPAPEDLRARHYWSTSEINPPFEVPMLPRLWMVTGLIALFVIVVGPVNFYILRRKRRLELAWATIPGLSVFFFVAIYVYGILSKGSDHLYASAEILQLRSADSKGLLLWTASQFSPAGRNYRFSAPNGGTVLPLLHYYDPPDPGKFQFLKNIGMIGPNVAAETSSAARAYARKDGGYDLINRVEQWTTAFYQGERPVEINGSVIGRVTILAGDGSSVRLHAENKTEADLSDATLYVGQEKFRLGDIQSGASVDRTFNGSSGVKSNVPADPPKQPLELDKYQVDASDKIRDGAYSTYPILPLQNPQRRCRIMARQSKWTSEVKIEPEPNFKKVCSLVEIELPVEIEGQVTFSSDKTLRREVYDFDSNGTTFYERADQFCALSDSWIEVLFAPPPLVSSARFTDGEIHGNFVGYNYDLTARAFNYETGAWDAASEQTGADSGMSAKLKSIRVKPEWVNPSGRQVRLRLEARDPQGEKQTTMGSFRSLKGARVAIGSLEASLSFVGSPAQNEAALEGNSKGN